MSCFDKNVQQHKRVEIKQCKLPMFRSIMATKEEQVLIVKTNNHLFVCNYQRTSNIVSALVFSMVRALSSRSKSLALLAYSYKEKRKKNKFTNTSFIPPTWYIDKRLT